MNLALAVVRTLYLAFVVVYLLVALPWGLLVSSEAKLGTVAVGLDTVQRVATAAWLAVAWIAVETAGAWVKVWLARRKAAAATPAAPPAAPAT